MHMGHGLAKLRDAQSEQEPRYNNVYDLRDGIRTQTRACLRVFSRFSCARCLRDFRHLRARSRGRVVERLTLYIYMLLSFVRDNVKS